jgi:hypothetical protein
VFAGSTVWSLTDNKKMDPAVQAQMADLDASIREKIGDSLPKDEVNPVLAELFPNVPDDLFLPEEDIKYDQAQPKMAMLRADDYTPEEYDQYLTAKVLLPNMGNIAKAKGYCLQAGC